MRTLYRNILESLKGLDKDATRDTFDMMAQSAGFEEKFDLDENVMFIFPDGRLIGVRGTAKLEPLSDSDDNDVSGPSYIDRDVYHQHISMFTPMTAKNIHGEIRHPIYDQILNDVHNLIIVAAYHYSGNIFIPEDTDVTPEQQKWLDVAAQKGYKIRQAKNEDE